MNLLGSRAGTALRARMSPLRKQKHVSAAALNALLAGFAAEDGGASPPRVSAARHPLHGLPLASLVVAARRAPEEA